MAHLYNSITPMARGEVKTRESPEAHWPAAMEYGVWQKELEKPAPKNERRDPTPGFFL